MPLTPTTGRFPLLRAHSQERGQWWAHLRGMGFAPYAVVGKPSEIPHRIALEQINAPKEAWLTIGDRLETDILGAKNAGIDSALVLTGISSKEDIHSQGIRPTWVAEDLSALSRRSA